MNQGVIVKDSKIHCKGVFATRDFKKGEVVVTYSLKPLTDKEYYQLPESEKHYTSYENGKYWLFSVPERFVNHSCDPNTNPKNKRDVAAKDIR